MKKYIFVLNLLIVYQAIGQERDTLKLKITKIVKTDTIYNFSSRVDTIALQPIITDTSKIVKDVNPQDLENSKYQVRMMGSVRINSYYDHIGMSSTEGFLPYDIPVQEEKVSGLSSVYIGARQSRFGVEGTANTRVGKIKIYMEVDFVSNTSSLWRLRHAFAEWNYFKLGYTWSTFMDNASLPNTVEFEGPNSALSKRNGVIRYERKYGENHILGVSLEAPKTDYFNPADSLIEGRNIQSNFDVASRYKYTRKWGHVQIAGIFRRIDYLRVNRMDVLYGWGLMLSAVGHLNPKNTLFMQYSVGEGIANYLVGFEGRKLDAVYNSITQDMSLKNIHGGFLTYTLHLKNWWVSVTSGISYIEVKNFEPSDTFRSSNYLAVNTFYKPIETIELGLELTAGTRTNFDNKTGAASRVSVIARFGF